ncbi:DNA-binding transcriptional response regulator, NtrC family, contains REC, AAA-type ATPase, and a Fis-type DNA-binding domains [Mesorhizobium albiziae]|uniref:DNA-binding transcriptional response regulator, NtrC family, contains REC, AAA-type ATPase, and a Fis-type DNA-binding domains n=1 Tax=Neomesorhizobium albiziae TaxID=335020 RepID=A0A1I4CUV1_9HYPH|nr:sigma-54 dependent transcriptional regulator [Mesorhizobium albiziae]GLS31050.1 transcriptional regulatory protein ZraR [Mesorhizobium albiziae]SFK85032.1 DNA-binding transcriptional response regulator, NtrC family, contains REC, AAA-type ATPase, and a Fis-type DNA-binding domains [Mesorhizobium albiziae]
MNRAMPPDRARIGLVEDDPVMGGSIVQRLELEGWDVIWWQTGSQAVGEIAGIAGALDLVICDIRLSDISGETVFEELARQPNVPPFLFVTGFGDIDQAVRLMRSGAVDFMTKPFAMDDFLKRIETGRRATRAGLRLNDYVLGQSPAIQHAENLIHRYAAHDLPVLVTGETGSGKEVAARLLHQLSARASEPFVAVNCAAIPTDLLESEIFGHEKGAFTGAHQRHLGYAERAKGGTLFLDEIGDMPSALQAKLLRLIESASFSRLGGETQVPFRARIVTATHRNLNPGEASGFREDLYFRLAVLPVDIPPLRQRPEDVVWFLGRFLEDAVGRSDVRIRGYSSLTEEAALAHPWPGNIRELRNRVDRAVALATSEWLMTADLFPEKAAPTTSQRFVPLSDVRNAAERRQIERALEHTGGQIIKAAELLGVARTTLWEKMTRLGMRY